MGAAAIPLAIGGSALLGFGGQRSANKANMQMSREQMKWQSGEAELNRAFQSRQAANMMGFQEMMSNTAVSRRMTDLKRAGINPIMAGKFDASSPSGAQGSGSQASPTGLPTQQSELGAAVSSATAVVSLLKLRSEIEQIKQATNTDRYRGTNIVNDSMLKSQTWRTRVPDRQIADFKARLLEPALGNKSGTAKGLEMLMKKGDKLLDIMFNKALENK